MIPSFINLHSLHIHPPNKQHMVAASIHHWNGSCEFACVYIYSYKYMYFVWEFGKREGKREGEGREARWVVRHWSFRAIVVVEKIVMFKKRRWKVWWFRNHTQLIMKIIITSLPPINILKHHIEHYKKYIKANIGDHDQTTLEESKDRSKSINKINKKKKYQGSKSMAENQQCCNEITL